MLRAFDEIFSAAVRACRFEFKLCVVSQYYKQQCSFLSAHGTLTQYSGHTDHYHSPVQSSYIDPVPRSSITR